MSKHLPGLSALGGCAAWLCLFYGTNGFFFGVANNVEELPSIYQLAGVAEFPEDPLVASLTSRWNQATPYIQLLGYLVRVVGLTWTPALFFVINAIVLCICYFSLRSLLRSLCRPSEPLVLLALTLILVIDCYRLMPNERVLFFNFLDPEHLSISLCLAATAMLARNRWIPSTLLLFTACIVHPLYALPVIGSAWCVAGIRWIRGEDNTAISAVRCFLVGIAGVPYSLFLWAVDRQGGGGWDVSLVQESIRSPLTHEIPLPWTENFWLAWSIPIALTVTSVVADYRSQPVDRPHRRNGSSPPVRTIVTIAGSIALYMFSASILSVFVRVPLVVKLTPYRMSVVLIPLLFVIAMSLLLRAFPNVTSSLSGRLRQTLAAAIGIGCLFYAVQAPRLCFSLDPHHGQWLNPEGTEVLRYIRQSTASSDLFLNYSDLDVRTACLRSDVFRFKTIPLFTEAQRNWYDRLLIVNEVPRSISPGDHEAVMRHIARQRTISLARVVRQLNRSVRYVVVNRVPGFIDRYASCNGQGNLMQFDAGNLDLIVENSRYAVYRVPANGSRERIGS